MGHNIAQDASGRLILMTENIYFSEQGERLIELVEVVS